MRAEAVRRCILLAFLAGVEDGAVLWVSAINSLMRNVIQPSGMNCPSGAIRPAQIVCDFSAVSTAELGEIAVQ